MALTQFNQFDPKLAGLEGNMQAEPRILTHDAVAVVIGAINNSDSNHGISITNAGSSYSVDDEITLTTNGTATGAAIIVVDEISGTPGSGAVTDYHVKTGDEGVGYTLTGAASIQQDAGVGVFACVITNIDIPHTQKRGCCLYSGASQTVQVELESGNTVSFVGVNAGSFLPILAKRLVTGTNIVALY